MSCETVKRNSEFAKNQTYYRGRICRGWRLSCASKVEDDIEVEVPDIASAYRSRMKVADLSSPEEVAIFDNAKADVEAAGIVLKNDMEVVDVTMDAPSLEDTMPDNERLMRALKKQMQAEHVILPYTVICKMADAAGN